MISFQGIASYCGPALVAGALPDAAFPQCSPTPLPRREPHAPERRHSRGEDPNRA
jgi:hypothetical protein